MKIILANPRGFCAGVNMAIECLDKAISLFGPNIYVYHEIVHNKYVVERFTQQGVAFVNEISEVPEGSILLYSAHGVSPEIREQSRRRNLQTIDATCPLVTKVHLEAVRYARDGYHIVLIGHEGHEEAVGTMAVAPDSISRVESVAEVLALPAFDEPVALLAQTTLSHRDWEGVAVAVRERYPDVWSPGRSDLCFATTNRQSALMAMAPQCDAIVVIGSANSSNTRALEKLAIEAGCPQVFRVNGAEELPADLHGTVGVTAGASAPEELVEAIIARLSPTHGVELLRVTEEDEYFPPPRNIRDLQAAIGVAAAAMSGGPVEASTVFDDRRLAASDVLATLLDS